MSDRTVWTCRRLRWLLGAAFVLGVPSVAQAATVTTTADSGAGSLREAITNSASGESIGFSPALNGQTITLTSGALVVPHALTIAGPGPSNLTISGNHASRVFNIAAGVSDAVTVSGLTITAGAFTGSAPGTGGGAVFEGSGQSLTLDDDVITGNQVTMSAARSAGGGGVYVNGGSLSVTGSTITDNTVSITGAAGSNGGGGLYANGGDIVIDSSTVSANRVTQTANTSSESDGGGGIYDNGGEIDVTDGSVTGNSDHIDSSGGSDGGGGIYANGGPVSLDGATVDANSFTLDAATDGENGGGAAYSNGNTIGVVSSSVDGNALQMTDTSTAGSDGGGALFTNGGSVGVLLSSISQNRATVAAGGNDSGGGAVFDDGSDAFYLTSTLADNSITLSGASTQNKGGGAVFSFAGGLISNTTIAGNSINEPGGALFLESSSSGTFDLKDTILADNGADNCAGSVPFSTAGFNLESTNSCGLVAAGDLVNTEPRLGPLQLNGGATLTRALPADSPAVDGGTCSDIFGGPLTTDQRGVARPQPVNGNCDIGAFELAGGGIGGSGSGGSSPPPPLLLPPAAVPGTPSATSSTGASFSGSVNPQGQATTVFFQYGIDARDRPGGATGIVYDQSTSPQTLPADSSPHSVSASVSGLVANALYHVRLAATNAAGTTFGPDQTFTTLAGAAPPPPVLGRSVNVKPVTGQVFVLVGTKLVPLTEGQQLPSGAVIDARAGSLQLTAALAGHKRETGVFGGAVFKLTQAGNGLTSLSLAEGAFPGAPTYASCATHRPGAATAAALSSKTLQLLHASAHGKFRTGGRYSAATVRGTKWSIADRCDGTLTRDISHSVAVTDFVRHKTIVLHAGQSYLARAPHKR